RRGEPNAEPTRHAGAGLAVLLVLVQIALGVVTVLTRLDPAVSVLHLAVATLLFGLLVRLCAHLQIQPDRAGSAAAAGADRRWDGDLPAVSMRPRHAAER